ncbi:hypothetical protein AN958_00166 [Leucoagaricus sp. SymC.cos]|nr:hypothetical protein AN958_00166 [Leucoagaricus sp. SymC.cos]
MAVMSMPIVVVMMILMRSDGLICFLKCNIEFSCGVVDNLEVDLLCRVMPDDVHEHGHRNIDINLERHTRRQQEQSMKSDEATGRWKRAMKE